MILSAMLGILFTLFDGYVSRKRIKKYGPFAELNLAVRTVIRDYGLTAGLMFGLWYNVGIILLLMYLKQEWMLTFFAGIKFGLVLMQLKSMQMETFVEQVLAAARKKKGLS